MRVLHLSDLHLKAKQGASAYGRYPDAGLDAALRTATARDAHFDLVAVTGDVADDASQPAYRRVHQRLRGLGDALRWVPGNHDEPDLMCNVDGEAFDDIAIGAWQFISVDSRWPSRTAGRVTAAELDRLDRTLGSPGPAHRAILIHHPPQPPCTDADCQIAGGHELVDVLDRHANVRLVLSGHLHHSFSVHRNKVAWIGAPSTFLQVTHPEHTYTSEPPAANLLHLGDDGSVTAEVLQELRAPV